MPFFWNKCAATEHEDVQGHRERVLSHYVVYFTQFTVIISFSAVLTSMWPYLNKLDPTASKTFLGYLIAFSALGQTIFSPIIGWWSNRLKSTRIPFITSIIICTIAYAIHANLHLFPSHAKYWMLFSRFLAGVGASDVSICRSHISTTTLLSERRKAVSILSSIATIALALGPALQSVVIPLGEIGVNLSFLKLDMYTTVGWIIVIMSLLNVLLFHPAIFKEHSMLGKEEAVSIEETYKSDNYKVLAWAFILMNFMVTFNFMFTKVLSNPLAMDEFAMKRSEAITLNSIVMIGSTIVSFITILSIHPLCKIFSEMKVLIIGLSLLVIGRACFYPWGDGPPKIYDDRNITCANCEPVGCPLSQSWCPEERKILFHQYIIANVVENIGYSLAITLVMAIFSKVLGSKQQGTWMGFLTSFGSLARITAPVFISTLYANYGPGLVTIVTDVIFFLIVLILLKLFNHFLTKEDPMERLEETGANLLNADNEQGNKSINRIK